MEAVGEGYVPPGALKKMSTISATRRHQGVLFTNPLTEGYPITAALDVRIPAEKLGFGNIVRGIRVSYSQFSAVKYQTWTSPPRSESLPTWSIPYRIKHARRRQANRGAKLAVIIFSSDSCVASRNIVSGGLYLLETTDTDKDRRLTCQTDHCRSRESPEAREFGPRRW